MEKEKWKPFHNALDKSDRKIFDEMFDIPRLYILACSNSVHYVRLHRNSYVHTTYHFKQLAECTSEVVQIEAKLEGQQQKKEEGKEIPTILDSYFISKYIES